MSISESTKNKFLYPESVIKEYAFWTVLFRFQQITVGSMILISTTGAQQLGDLSREAWAEFAEVSKDVEQWTRMAFGAEKFNYLALMMKEPEVHFHFIPRYSHPVIVDDMEFVDSDWPLATNKMPMELNATALDTIKMKITEVIK